MTGARVFGGILVQIDVKRDTSKKKVTYVVEFKAVGSDRRHPDSLVLQTGGKDQWRKLDRTGDFSKWEIDCGHESQWGQTSARLSILDAERFRDPSYHKVTASSPRLGWKGLHDGVEARVSIKNPDPAMDDLFSSLAVVIGPHHNENLDASYMASEEEIWVDVAHQDSGAPPHPGEVTTVEPDISNVSGLPAEQAPANLGPPPGVLSSQLDAEIDGEVTRLRKENAILSQKVEDLNWKIEEFNKVAATAAGKTASDHRREIEHLKLQMKRKHKQFIEIQFARAQLADQVCELRKQIERLQLTSAQAPRPDGGSLSRLLKIIEALTAKGESDQKFAQRVRDELQPALVRLQGEVSHNPELQQSVGRTVEFISRSDPGGLEAARTRADDDPNEAIQMAIGFLEDRRDDRPALSPHNVEEQLKTIALQAFGDREMFESLRPALDSCLGAVGLSLLIPGTGQSYQSAHHQIMARRRAPGQGENRILKVQKPGLLRGDAVVAKAQVEIS
jgi:hypothetical protein